MKNISRILVASKPLYSIVGLIAALILFGAVLELSTPIVSKLIVDEIVAKTSAKGGELSRLIFLIGLMFVLSLLGIITTAVSERIGDHFAGKLRRLLTEKFYFKVLSLPQSYFDSELSGKIVNQLNRGISVTQNFVNASTNFILPMFLQSIFTIFVLARYSLPVALFTFLLFPIYLGISYYSSKKWGEAEEKKNVYEDLSRGRINEMIGNIKIIKGFNTQKREFGYVSEMLNKINQIYAGQSREFHLFDFARNFSLNVILLGINIKELHLRLILMRKWLWLGLQGPEKQRLLI